MITLGLRDCIAMLCGSVPRLPSHPGRQAALAWPCSKQLRAASSSFPHPPRTIPLRATPATPATAGTESDPPLPLPPLAPPEPQAPRKRGRPKAKAPPADIPLPQPPPLPPGPSEDELGWTCVPPSLIYRDYGTQPSSKIAAFDLDNTLIQTRSGATFSRGPGDWRFWSPRVPEVLRALHQQGYKLVVFSNQGGVKSALTGRAAATAKGKVHQMLLQAGVPALALMATGKDHLRKPDVGMWDVMCGELNGGVNPDKSRCFFVGDAAGRPSDFLDKATGAPADTDRQFAGRVGIEFKVPEEVFGPV